jgi:hypothetical protein
MMARVQNFKWERPSSPLVDNANPDTNPAGDCGAANHSFGNRLVGFVSLGRGWHCCPKAQPTKLPHRGFSVARCKTLPFFLLKLS